ncbi:MAG: hypothetical protein PHO26_02305 [Dehalococcoidia bacterium]|nr:hypothetical protein [Dehalococcoidia bacterium]MDD5494885.1 hypothetical protein [Dehalococcoidia bacterium]
MDAFFHSVLAARIIFIFAIFNLILGVLVFMSCRCLPGFKFAQKLMQNKSYLKFYKFHCYIWLVFLISVTIHAVFAIGFTGIPF